MKKILAIMGSPRKNKNTDILLQKVIEGIKIKDVEVNKIDLKDLKFSPCTACGYCEKTGKCIIQDDMQLLYEEFDKSDGIIVASPLYFNTVSSLVKMMIDRCQMFWASKYILNNPSIDVAKERIGMFICTGGAPYSQNQFDACLPVIDLFFKAINTKYCYNLLVANTDKVPVWERIDKLNEGYIMGENYFLKRR
ncbi:flavodoxin family protein [Caldisalinibacter kiritimatiensis]|uniref:NADPH-dependent FMN reductase-like domain-containing protein n=1 Tax=Caldisalinibacter kiritimatiensis TaxID=1304284 RepID=R1CRN9_9FIRM|nr:flavodoxin family protein [Caldisalinibacter kiritimatiensis]EOD01341.1 hypothetical protein L21TH_0562 [Caldisalinibacter kiritimatiensis]